MQKIEIHIRAESIKGVIVDAFNGVTGRKVSVLRGMQAELILQLFKSADSSDDEAKYSADDLASFTAWKMYADVDYDLQTAPKLLVDAGGITVDDHGKIHVVISETNTETLADAITIKPSIDLTCELLGYAAGASVPSFALHFPLTILNRVGMEGAATPVPVATLEDSLSDMLSGVDQVPADATVFEIISTLTQLLNALKGTHDED